MLIRRLLTRKVSLVAFSDGSVYVAGTGHPFPPKPPGTGATILTVRVWRWKRRQSALEGIPDAAEKR